MTPERWQQVKKILDGLEETPLRSRSAWLRNACDGDEDLLASVEEFLAQETSLEGFMEDGAPSRLQVDRGPAVDPEQEIGGRIGPYRLKSLLGRGGMGAVYEAVREDEFEQRVALKLALAGPKHPRVVQLFHNERQILAGLQHPNIAHLLDGGTDSLGRPYFAMELVEGSPIDVYCDEHRLNVRRRLELVVKVCDALQSAHQRLIVHRDIKPGNVMVDGDGTPKLLDFGIAKLLDSGSTMATATGSRPMTLLYASPEQLQSETITPASDVYSMGVLIYRLLTGVFPNRLDELSYLDLVLATCRNVPRKAGDEVGALDTEHGNQIAAARACGDAAGLRRRLVGDLDAILAKALRKKPTERYGSMERLAADLHRYLAGRPVRAQQGGRLYVASKFIRRNLWQLVVAGFAMAAMVVFGALILRADAAMEQSDLMRSYVEDVLFLADPWRWEAEDASWGELILRMPSYEELEKDETLRLSLSVVEVHLTRGEADPAMKILQDRWDDIVETFGEESFEVAEALHFRGIAYYIRGRLDDATRDQEDAATLAERLGAPDLYWSAVNNLAALDRRLKRNEKAEKGFSAALEARRRLYTGRPQEPESSGRYDLDAERRLYDLLSSLRNLSALKLDSGEVEASMDLCREARSLLAGREEDSAFAKQWADCSLSLARGLRESGRPEEALPLMREVDEERRGRLSPFDRLIGLIQKDLATVHIDLGNLDEAAERLDEAERILGHKAPRWQDQADLGSLRGLIDWRRGSLDEAEARLGEAFCISSGRGVRIARLAAQRYRDFLRETGRPDPGCAQP